MLVTRTRVGPSQTPIVTSGPCSWASPCVGYFSPISPSVSCSWSSPFVQVFQGNTAAKQAWSWFSLEPKEVRNEKEKRESAVIEHLSDCVTNHKSKFA